MQRSTIAFLALFAACGTLEVPEDPSQQGNETPDPTLESITPERGPLAGGNELTLSGTGFEEGIVVVIGGLAADAPTIESETTLTVTVPQGSTPETGLDVLIFGPSGFAALPEAYTYNSEPTLEGVSRRFGPLVGGDTIEAFGEFLQTNNPGTPTVSIAGVEATDIEVIDDSTIRFTTPAGVGDDVGIPQDILVSTTNGDASLKEAYSYFRPGLLLGSMRSLPGLGTGIFFFDLPTNRLVQLVETSIGFSRFFTADDGSIVLRHNNEGGLGRVQWSRLDVQTGVLQPVGTATDAVSGATLQISATTKVGNNFLALGNGQLGFFDLDEMTFSGIAGSAVNSFESCIAAKDANEVIRLSRLDGEIETININNGIGTFGNTITGNFDVENINGFICHGATLVGPDLFAIFKERGGAQGTILVSINPVTGVGSSVAVLPGEFAELEPTPPGGFQ